MNSTFHYEIERKFLLKQIPNLEYVCNYYIEQIYVNYKNDEFRIREQIDGRNNTYTHFLTKKEEVKIGVYKESEIIINSEEYEYYRNYGIKILHKQRQIYPINNLKWEIDIYNPPLRLLVGEIELPCENYELIIPNLIQNSIIMEVTKFPEFKNYNLAIPMQESNRLNTHGPSL